MKDTKTIAQVKRKIYGGESILSRVSQKLCAAKRSIFAGRKNYVTSRRRFWLSIEY